MTDPWEDLLVKAESAFDAFRAGFHAEVATSAAGEPGLTACLGTLSAHTLRSRIPAAVKLIESAIESLNGSGELPDSSALRLSAMNMGVGRAEYIATLWSVMGLVEVIYSIENGESDMVLRVFEGMNGVEAPPITSENTCSKKPLTQENTASPDAGEG